MEKEKKIIVDTILDICNGKLLTGDHTREIDTFSNDTRTINKGDLYISIQGENINGDNYIEEAFEKGAIGCITQNDLSEQLIKKYNDNLIIKVKDTIKAIQDLAKYKRNLYNIPVVAVTGSVGKTSTKDIISKVLEQKYSVLKTKGNFNNHIGLPLTLLGLNEQDAIVVEMGMNHFGEISILTDIAKPTIAVITNIGTSHIGILGSRENILKAKLEILEGLKDNGIIIINNDNDLLHEWESNNEKYNVCTYGIENKSNYMAYNMEENGMTSTYDIKSNNNVYKVDVPVSGRHFVYNSLCAFSVGKLLQLTEEDIIKGISRFELTSKRMTIKKIKNDITVIEDCYNASFDSVKAALETMHKMDYKRKIAVLGDMLELGKYSKEIHENVGKEVVKNSIDMLITVGEESRNIAKKAREGGIKEVYDCINKDEASNILKQKMQAGDLVLLKASNAMRFSEILNKIS